MSRENNSGKGRRARPRLNERFPNFPYVDLAHPDVNKVDVKLITFAKNVIVTIEEFQNKGWASSQRDFARKVGLNHATLLGILRGHTYPDAETIALLEVTTCRSLWEQNPALRGDRIPPAFRRSDAVATSTPQK